jgi:fatty-acyl-CoA synthase
MSSTNEGGRPASTPDPHAHHRFWPTRLPHRITTPATSLWCNLDVSAQRYPDKPALVFFDQALSYRELHAQVERLAAHLRQQGVQDGERVILFMQNCPQWVVAHFAILRANAVVVPVNPMNRAEELKHYIIDPDARVAIAAADLAGELLKANGEVREADRLRHLVVSHYSDAFGPAAEVPPAWAEWLGTRHPSPTLPGGTVSDWAEALACGGSAPAHNRGPDDLAVLPYTSGTTGLPKGCMHTHRTLMHNAVGVGLWTASTPRTGPAGGAHVPHHRHGGGHARGGVHRLDHGGDAALGPRARRPAHLALARARTGPTSPPWSSICWPARTSTSTTSPAWCYLGGGGAAMPQAVAQRLLDQFGLRYAEGYGLTETAAPSHNNPPDHPKQQCLGIPFLGVDARVVDPITLQEMPPGRDRRDHHPRPQVFDGYWKRPEATEAAFIDLDGKRFFRSGDLGRVDEDGYFFITDRLKRMINASGFKVWPARWKRSCSGTRRCRKPASSRPRTPTGARA